MSVEQTELCTLCSVGVTVTAAIDNHRETDNRGTTLIMVHGSEERDTKNMLFWQFFQSIASAFIFLMGAVNLQAAFYCYEEQSKSNASYFYVMSGSQNVMPPNLYLIIIIKCLAAWCR